MALSYLMLVFFLHHVFDVCDKRYVHFIVDSYVDVKVNVFLNVLGEINELDAVCMPNCDLQLFSNIK